MSRLIISPYKPSDWTGEKWTVAVDFYIDPNTMVEAIKSQWPDADVKINRFPETPLEWEFSTPFAGWLLADKQSVSITTGPKQSLLDFTFWYRAFVDSSIRLFLQNESSENTLELTTKTSAKEITEFVGY